MTLTLKTAAGADQLSATLADELFQLLDAKLAVKQTVTVVLTGGTMGISLLSSLADHPRLLSLDWHRVRLLWGDERWVPRSHADRNSLQAEQALLKKLPLKPELVLPIPASDSGLTIAAAAEQYATTVQSVIAGDGIDLVLLGVGPDGHVASIFPGHKTPDQPAAYPVLDSPKPPAERITLSLPALRSAAEVWLLFSGESKRDPLEKSYAELLRSAGYLSAGYLSEGDLSEGDLPGGPLPVARVSGRERTVVFADAAALPPASTD